MENEKQPSTLKIDIIERGIVIDHIQAGNSMNIYNYLNLSQLDCTVAIIKNVKSSLLGKKDIIKIENNLDIDLEALGYLDPNITINTIENGVISRKKNLMLPKMIKNIVKCKNPRCVTSIEQEIEHIFELSDEKNQTYRCIYCQQEPNKTI